MELIPGRYYAMTTDTDPRDERCIKRGPFGIPALARSESVTIANATERPTAVFRLSTVNPGKLERVP